MFAPEISNWNTGERLCRESWMHKDAFWTYSPILCSWVKQDGCVIHTQFLSELLTHRDWRVWRAVAKEKPPVVFNIPVEWRSGISKNGNTIVFPDGDLPPDLSGTKGYLVFVECGVEV